MKGDAGIPGSPFLTFFKRQSGHICNAMVKTGYTTIPQTEFAGKVVFCHAALFAKTPSVNSLVHGMHISPIP
jgi:hypothetical protein